MPLSAPAAYTAVAHVQASSAASRAVKYTVLPGDTLWSIAQLHYGSGFKWETVYGANSEMIGANPNTIYAGQVLTVPGVTAHLVQPSTQTTSSAPVTGTSAVSSPAVSSPSAQSSPSVRSVPSPRSSPPARVSASLPGVPSQAATYIRQAASGTGLPVSVVAAQNFVESGYGTNLGPSSAGAMGPWQFMPGTWPSYSNAPYSQASNWSASTSAYVAMMKQLLQWSGGNVQQALAAYNAGQGNWQAGLGYANTILARAS